MRRGKPWLLGVLLAGAMLFTATPVASAQAPGKAPKRLNFVVVLVDDLGWMDLSCQGSKFYKTPNIDRLARQGLRFTDGYAAAAICSPTRAAVMTGRYPARLGLTDWIRARFQRGKAGTPRRNPTEYVGGPDQKLLCPPNPFWMELDEVTIAEVLRALGYVTCHIGKWHLGDEAWFPQHQGFDFNFGGCDYGQPPSYFDPYANKKLTGIPHLPPRRKGELLTDREASEAVKFIHAHKDRPFFLHLAHYAVHTPLMAKPEVVAKYKGKGADGQNNAVYAALVESVDDAVGAVLKALDDAGVADHTVVVFTSDNGGLLGSTHNGPLRLGKGHAYEGGIRVPWIVRWPGVVHPGTVSHEAISSIDLFPTVVEAAGGKLPRDRAIDGISLIGHLKSGGREKLKRAALFWHFPHYRHPPGPYSIIRAGDWKLTKFYEGPKLELYNLRDDLGEKNDLAAKVPEKVKELHERLKAHLKAVGAKLPRPNPNYAAGGTDRRQVLATPGQPAPAGTDANGPPFYADRANLLVYLDGDGKPVPVRTTADWRKRRDHVLANMQLVMGPLPPNARKVPLDLKVEAEETLPQVVRRRITFAVETGDRVPAYLLIPRGQKGKAPAVLCLHQTTKIGSGEPAGVGGLANLHYALELAERGYVTLAPDYPNFGGYRIDPYARGYASATMKGIWNHLRAVDLLQALPEVDGMRIGCIGHSLGGHNALFVAAFDPRLKVVVTSS